MNKKKKGRKLSREKGQRRALLKIMAGNLILKERIRTTRAKAKETAIFTEKLITLAKKQGLDSLRRVLAVLPERAAFKLIKDLAGRYAHCPGGYTRVLKVESRLADGAEMAIVELVKQNAKESPARN